MVTGNAVPEFFGKMGDWKNGMMDGWKNGRLEEWKDGWLEEWNDITMEKMKKRENNIMKAGGRDAINRVSTMNRLTNP